MIAGRLGHCIFERLLQEPAIALGSLSTLTNGAHAVEKLPDQLQDHLRLVFVGTSAGQRSADVGHYYAHSGNRFWRTLHEVGITPRLYEPHEFPSLSKLGIGFTDMCKVGAGMDHEALNFPIDVSAFREKMLRYRPKTIAFTSKKAASLSMDDRRKRLRWAASHHKTIFQRCSYWLRRPAPQRVIGQCSRGGNSRIRYRGRISQRVARTRAQ